MAIANYDEYVRTEWELYLRNPGRACASLKATENIEINRVLDVGCGAGQELIPFVTVRGAEGYGVDISPEVGHAGRQLFATLGPHSKVTFLQASAEQLPFDDYSFDVVLCRVALPYTNNKRALSEVGRVLRPGGIFILKIHHARYYLGLLAQGILNHNRSAVYAMRVLSAGILYHFTGSQPTNRWTGQEVFQTAWMLRREAVRSGMTLRGELSGSDSNPQTPIFVFVKGGVTTPGSSASEPASDSQRAHDKAVQSCPPGE